MGDAYVLQVPRNQLFYRLLASIMSMNAIGNQTWWGFSAPNKFFVLNSLLVIIFGPIILASQLVYLFVNFSQLTFSTLGILFAIIPVTLLTNVALVSSRQGSYKKFMKDFMGRIHLHNYQDQHELAKSILIDVERYSRWTFYFLCVFLMVDCGAWCIITGVHSVNNREEIRNKTVPLQTVIYMIMPFDYEYNYRNWIIMHLINSYIAYCGCITIVIFNTINYISIFHLIGHIQILKHKIKALYSETRSKNEDRKSLIGIIEYHSFVLQIFKDIESAFGLNISGNYFYNLIADSLLLYQIVVGDKENLIMYGLMVVVYVGGLILMSFVLEEIRRQSDNLSDLVYNIPWEQMSVSNQKMVLLILVRIQPVLVFEAAGGLRAGVRPMISILKTTFSYYVMLKSSI